ncbi:MAG TPA: hypothetical protein DEB25_02800 [Desulfobulbaceae bacterium]|nr:hypothetical protein [Desulfobulbaceae bacterium]
MKRCLSLFFCLIFILQGLLFFRQPSQGIIQNENRRLAQWPSKLVWNNAGFKEYTAAADKYFGDRIIWRQTLIELAARAKLALHDVPNFEKAFLGKENWLFFGNVGNFTVAKLTGNIGQQTQFDSNWFIAHVIETFDNYKNQGVPGIFLLGPNKSSVYGEYLPDFIHPTKRRYSASLLEKISQAKIPVSDPTTALLVAKPQGYLYWKSDSHWNFFGASIAFQAFLNQLRNSFGYNLELPPFTIETADKGYLGDLYKIAGISDYHPDVIDNYLLTWSAKGNLTETNMANEQGGSLNFPLLGFSGSKHRTPQVGQPIRVVNTQAASELRVWLFHDSFSVALSPFFHAIFAETWHFHQADFGKASVEQYGKPDLIVYESVERYL